MKKAIVGLALVSAVVLSGCASMGSHVDVRDRVDMLEQQVTESNHARDLALIESRVRAEELAEKVLRTEVDIIRLQRQIDEEGHVHSAKP